MANTVTTSGSQDQKFLNPNSQDWKNGSGIAIHSSNTVDLD